jgi:penicillin-binding protein 2
MFHCWKKGGHGRMSMANAIVQSCDVYFYEIALRTGIDNIAAMARRLGLGQLLNIELSGERRGLIPTRAWKKKVKRVSWQKGETLLAGIGQGLILATPLQLVVMMARIVNGGKAVLPRLAMDPVQKRNEEVHSLEPEFANLGIHSPHLELMKEAMQNVTVSPIGTAYKARIRKPGYDYGGKTGTVQVRRISKAERESELGVRKNRDLKRTERDHALFVGYAPIESPRYAVSVVVEHGGGGSTAAAPIAKDILLEVQNRYSSRLLLNREHNLEEHSLLNKIKIES